MDTTKNHLTAPRVGVIAVTYKGDDLLLIQRGKEPNKYGWGFPGGSVNPGESLHHAACRELLEETQIKATAEQNIDVIEVNEFDKHGIHHHFVLVAVLCRYESGNAVASDDALDCKWLSIEQITSGQHDLIHQVPTVVEKTARLIRN